MTEQEKLEKRIAIHSKAMNKLSTNVTPQKRLEQKERLLQELVKVMPITIEYGCHTIELKHDPSYPCHFHGYSFRAVENDGKGLKIEMN